MKKSSVKTIIPAILLILIVIALAIVTGYALSLESRVDGQYTDIQTVSQSPVGTAVLRTAVPATPSPAPTIEPIPAGDAPDADLPNVDPPYWSDGLLVVNDTYRSPDMSVTVRKIKDSELFDKQIIYYVADVHVSDVTLLRTGCHSGNFKNTGRGMIDVMAKRENALVAISGDFIPSLVIRNGELYQKKISERDICLLLKNGEMEIIKGDSTNITEIMKKDPWQAWQFGPGLLESDGTPRKSLGSYSLNPKNPRSCIGYIEPGHYCFVVADGRQKASRGLTLTELAMLMQSLGCKQAFNLDGGASAHFYWNGKIRNNPSGGGREISDIIYVAKESYPEARFFCGKAGASK